MWVVGRDQLGAREPQGLGVAGRAAGLGQCERVDLASGREGSCGHDLAERDRGEHLGLGALVPHARQDGLCAGELGLREPATFAVEGHPVVLLDLGRPLRERLGDLLIRRLGVGRRGLARSGAALCRRRRGGLQDGVDASLASRLEPHVVDDGGGHWFVAGGNLMFGAVGVRVAGHEGSDHAPVQGLRLVGDQGQGAPGRGNKP